MSCDCVRPKIPRLEFVKRVAALWFGFARRRGVRRAAQVFAAFGDGIMRHFEHGGTLPCRAVVLEGMEKLIAKEELPLA